MASYNRTPPPDHTDDPPPGNPHPEFIGFVRIDTAKPTRRQIECAIAKGQAMISRKCAALSAEDMEALVPELKTFTDKRSDFYYIRVTLECPF